MTATFTIEQKTQLAKLMATENLTIQHSKISTAKFDPINRTLYLPIWKDMSSFLYDLLCGHEVGHALFTPPQGWHDVATDKTKGKNYKSFLNVIEDARIEKKVIRKYPGLKPSFRKAYLELTERGFFGTMVDKINDRAFIDRLNIYTKSQYTQNINFSVEEMQMIGEVQMLETWEDVIRVTNKIYGYSKDEQLQSQMNDFNNSFASENEAEYDKEDNEMSPDIEESDDDFENDQGENDSSKQKNKEQKNDLNDDNSIEDDNDDYDNDENGNRKQINRNKNSSESNFDMDDFEPTCETDNNYRKNEITLLDEKSKPYAYVILPTPNLTDIITPAKRVQELLSDFFNEQIAENSLTNEKINEYVQDFRNKNERYVALLAKEFEMRKAAKAFSKAKQSDTGDIDVNKLATYCFDDNIFRKIMQVPKGKSHGLILLLDYSGSMSDNMAGSIEQILILSLFCRKVNIPFNVYAFSNDDRSWTLDRNFKINAIGHVLPRRTCFSQNEGELNLENVSLREYLNSKMTNAEFTKALRNMILLKMSYVGGRYNRVIPRPYSENLSNTPLTEAIIATQAIMKLFKKSNNLDITNLIIIHDGDADFTYTQNLNGGRKLFDATHQNVIIQDNRIKYQKQMVKNSLDNECFVSVCEWFTATTNSQIFGFFIMPHYKCKNIINHYYHDINRIAFRSSSDKNRLILNELNKLNALKRKFDTQKFLQSFNPGYNSFFLISGGNELMANNGEIEIDGKITSSKLKNAFMKFNKRKQINRVLVSKFIQGIAA